MKLIVRHDRIEIEPETHQDRCYLRHALGLHEPGQQLQADFHVPAGGTAPPYLSIHTF